jgi:aminocarboxymuconate-semialdehyde decarboxylase
MIIDVHAHALSASLLDRFARDGAFGFHHGRGGEVLVRGYGEFDRDVYDHEERLERLADMKVDLQLISPMLNLTSWPGTAADVELARALNQSTADCVAGSGGRFAGLAALALGEPRRAVEELGRAVEEHGFVGAAIGTYAGDRPLDHPSLEPVFAEIERRGLPLLMHPTSAVADAPPPAGQGWTAADQPAPSWDEYTLTTILAWPNETARATARLIFAGTLERHPDLRLVLSHGGGTLPFLRGRLNLAYTAPKHEYNPDCHAYISKPPGEYLDQLLFDTAVGAAESLHFLIDNVGAERVVLGTDDPFEIGDTGARMAMPALSEREPAEADQILGGTLKHLLRPASSGR